MWYYGKGTLDNRGTLLCQKRQQLSKFPIELNTNFRAGKSSCIFGCLSSLNRYCSGIQFLSSFIIIIWSRLWLMMGKYSVVIWICEDVYLFGKREILLIQSFFNLPQVAVIYIHVDFFKVEINFMSSIYFSTE